MIGSRVVIHEQLWTSINLFKKKKKQQQQQQPQSASMLGFGQCLPLLGIKINLITQSRRCTLYPDPFSIHNAYH